MARRKRRHFRSGPADAEPKAPEPKAPEPAEAPVRRHRKARKPAERDNRASTAVFFFAVVVTGISMISVVFPAAMTSTGQAPVPGLEYTGPGIYEFGPWAAPVLAGGAAILGVGFMQYMGMLPPRVTRVVAAPFRFEVSRKVSYAVMAAMLVPYAALSYGELYEDEEWEDYAGILARMETWTPETALTSTEPHVKYAFIYASMQAFGNYAVLPFVSSIVLVLLVFETARTISGKRFAALISAAVLMQSGIFLTYDTSVTYDSFWTLLYLTSIYLVVRLWQAAPAFYLLSIPAKALTVAFLPMSVYFVLRSGLPARRRIVMAVGTAMVLVIMAAVFVVQGTSTDLITGRQEAFSASEFWEGFTSFAYQMRFDGLVLVLLMPLLVGLTAASRLGVRHADSIMVMISGMLLIAPFLTGFSDQTNQPYRFLPLIAFVAIGIGAVLGKAEPDGQPPGQKAA